MGAAPKPKPNVVALRALKDTEALAWLVQRGRVETSTAALARDWRWSSTKVKRHLDRWSAAGDIEVRPGLGGRTVIAAKGEPAGEATAPVSGVSPVPAVVSATTAIAPAASTAVAETPAVANAVEAAAPATAADNAETVAPVSEPVASSQSASRVPPTPAVAPEPESAAIPAKTVVAKTVVAKPAAVEPAATEPLVEPPAAQPAVVHAPVATVLPPPISPLSMSPPSMPDAAALHPRGSGFVNAMAYLVAVALAGIAAFFSISGMIVLFPGAPTAIVVMGVAMEAAKLVTVAFLAHQWRTLAWLSRLVLIVLVAGLAAINAAGVYSQLVAAHFGDRVSATSEAETEAATLAAKAEVQTQTVADLDRRVGQIDAAIAEMTKRGRAAGALDAIATQRKQRDALVGQRRQEAEKLAAIKSDAAAVAARSHRIEIEAAPIMYVAQLMGGSTEQAIRLLILPMVLTCDPLAVALTAAASRPWWKR